jgi:hypothetical protein
MTRTRIAILGALAALGLLATPRGAGAADPDVLTREEIRAAIQRIVDRDQSLHGGYFLLWDAATSNTWRLKHQSVHERVAFIDSPVARRMLAERGVAPGARAEEIVYFACNNFVSAEGTLVDVDVWMARSGDKLSPIQYRIHKVNGKPRYAFRNDEIVPLDAATE